MSLMQAWGVGVEEWAGATGSSVERLCVELEISRARLTMLTKEYCGMTAQELVDGFRIRRVKRGLIERLREAAQELWGTPGSYAATKYEAPMDANDVHGRGRPCYYEDRATERARRIEELAARMREDFDFEGWAVRAGFG